MAVHDVLELIIWYFSRWIAFLHTYYNFNLVSGIRHIKWLSYDNLFITVNPAQVMASNAVLLTVKLSKECKHRLNIKIDLQGRHNCKVVITSRIIQQNNVLYGQFDMSLAIFVTCISLVLRKWPCCTDRQTVFIGSLQYSWICCWSCCMQRQSATLQCEIVYKSVGNYRCELVGLSQAQRPVFNTGRYTDCM
jgi:hypothetical protein